MGPSLFVNPMASITGPYFASNYDGRRVLSHTNKVCVRVVHHALITHWYTFCCNFFFQFYAMNSNTLASQRFHKSVFLYYYYSSKQLQKKVKQNKLKKNELLIKAIYAWRQTVCIL